jgi:hypothetical protein
MTTKPKSDETVTPPHAVDNGTTTPNPFNNLAALRNPQDYEEFLGGEAVTAFAVRTLKEAMHVRVNPDPDYTLIGQYTALTKNGVYFVYPQFRDALGPLPRRCNLHIAVDGHGEYFLLLVKQANPGQEDNNWYSTARAAAAAATLGWIKITKPTGRDRGWGHVPVTHAMLTPRWPTKPFDELLCSAFPDRVVDSLNHDLIRQFETLGA